MLLSPYDIPSITSFPGCAVQAAREAAAVRPASLFESTLHQYTGHMWVILHQIFNIYICIYIYVYI